jgi:LmbE family N-acetylglucosaminyl deacetylase
MNVATSVVVVAPHPDDETLGCGGVLALLAGERASVHVAFVTDGTASHPGHPVVTPSEMAARRVAEARVATRVLGIASDNLTFLGARDGTLSHLDQGEFEEIAGGIAGILRRFAPGLMLLPCRHDGSSEHDAAFTITQEALEQAGLKPRILEYPVWSWWNPLLLIGPLFTCRRIWRVDIRGVLDVKARALSSYASQMLPIPPDSTAVLPPGFTSMFLCGEEFLFER